MILVERRLRKLDFNKEPEPIKSEVKVSWDIYQKLKELGMLGEEEHSFNVGASDYSKHFIQPWMIWQEYNLNAWDADIVKRVLRTKETDSRVSDYEKIIHICRERIRQLTLKNQNENL